MPVVVPIISRFLPSCTATVKKTSFAGYEFTSTGSLAMLAKSAFAGDGLAQDKRMYFARSFVRKDRLEVVHVPDDRVLERYAVCAENRSRLTRDLERFPHVVQLTEADVRWMCAAFVFHAADVQRQQRALVQFEKHVDE